MSPNLNRREFLGTLAAASALAIPATSAAKEPWGGAFIIMQTPFLESLEVDVDSLKRETDFLVRVAECREWSGPPARERPPSFLTTNA